MTPNKLPPLPETWYVMKDEETPAYDDEHMRAYGGLSFDAGYAEALRQSQSLPAGAVTGLAGLVDRWREHFREMAAYGPTNESLARGHMHCADELEDALSAIALQAYAREKGEASGAATLLRAMVRNYKHGHCWDHLDAKACTAAADQIDRLLATQPAQASEASGDAARLDFMVHRGANIDCYYERDGGHTVYRVTAFGNILTDWNPSYREAIDTAIATSSQETASE